MALRNVLLLRAQENNNSRITQYMQQNHVVGLLLIHWLFNQYGCVEVLPIGSVTWQKGP